jgi:hypothetical protein
MIHRAVSVSFVSKKKNGTSPATLLREASIQSRKASLAHDCAGRDGPYSLLPGAFRQRPSATVCKAACIDTQQTVKNDLNLAFAW